MIRLDDLLAKADGLLTQVNAHEPGEPWPEVVGPCPFCRKWEAPVTEQGIACPCGCLLSRQVGEADAVLVHRWNRNSAVQNWRVADDLRREGGALRGRLGTLEQTVNDLRDGRW